MAESLISASGHVTESIIKKSVKRRTTGTQAFLANRELLQHLTSLTAFQWCRTPIDKYLVRVQCFPCSPVFWSQLDPENGPEYSEILCLFDHDATID